MIEIYEGRDRAMEGYRVLLVDDEVELRGGISRKICWEELGFSLVGEAGNGLDALELAEQVHPDVVMTDIKMPFMDGLELCRILRQRFPALRLIVFSGFDDFEYARQAIGMNVFEYILKPVNAAELSDVLRRLRREMDDSRAEYQNLQELRRRYEESLPVLRGIFYARLLDGKLRAAQVRDRAARYEIPISGGSYVAALIHVGCLGENPDELIFLSLQALVQEHFSLSGCTAHIFIYNDNLALVTTFSGMPVIYSLIEELERVRRLGHSELDLTLTVGVGLAVEEPWHLSQSAKGAQTALDYRILLGADRTIYIGDLEPQQDRQLAFEESDQRELTSAVKFGNPSQVHQQIDALMAKVHGVTLSQCQCFFMEVVTCLIKLTREGGIPLDAVFGADFTGAVQVTDFASPEEMGGWCSKRCVRLQELLGRQRSDTAWRMADRARAFVAREYADCALSVESLCAHIHLSPAYFSTLFKRETGMSFTAYVTNVRMDAAAGLLRSTEEKTYLIAQQVGYADPNYFSYVFKRHFGTSPSKYRANQAGADPSR